MAVKKPEAEERVFQAFGATLDLVFQQFGIPHILHGPAFNRMKRQGAAATREFMERMAARGIHGVFDADELDYLKAALRDAVRAHIPPAQSRQLWENVLQKVQRVGLYDEE